jgi:hypothetical protein
MSPCNAWLPVFPLTCSFRHPQCLSRLNARSLLAPSFPISPLVSSSSIFLAALTSRFPKFALHRLLEQRKTFRVYLRAIFMLASLARAPDEGSSTQRYHIARGSVHRLAKHVLYLSSRRPALIARRVRPVC